VVSTPRFAEAKFAEENPDSANAKPRLEGGVCKSFRSRKEDQPMVLLMLLVCLFLRLRRVGVKIDFWF